MQNSPEAVRAEMAYRLERAQSDVRNGTTLEHLHAARANHPSWWRRVRVQHRPTKDAA